MRQQLKQPEAAENTPSVKIFLGLSNFQILAMFRRGLFYTYLSIYLLKLGLSVTATTLFATIPMVLSAFFQTFVWGSLSDKMQKRRTFIVLGELIAGSLIIIIYWIHDAVANIDLILAGYTLIFGLGILEIFWSRRVVTCRTNQCVEILRPDQDIDDIRCGRGYVDRDFG